MPESRIGFVPVLRIFVSIDFIGAVRVAGFASRAARGPAAAAEHDTQKKNGRQHVSYHVPSPPPRDALFAKAPIYGIIIVYIL